MNWVVTIVLLGQRIGDGGALGFGGLVRLLWHGNPMFFRVVQRGQDACGQDAFRFMELGVTTEATCATMLTIRVACLSPLLTW